MMNENEKKVILTYGDTFGKQFGEEIESNIISRLGVPDFMNGERIFTAKQCDVKTREAVMRAFKFKNKECEERTERLIKDVVAMKDAEIEELKAKINRLKTECDEWCGTVIAKNRYITELKSQRSNVSNMVATVNVDTKELAKEVLTMIMREISLRGK